VQKKKPRSCYGCIHYSHGDCLWFERYRQQRKRRIPLEVLLKGCSHQESKYKQTSTTKIVAYILEKFDGEII